MFLISSLLKISAVINFNLNFIIIPYKFQPSFTLLHDNEFSIPKTTTIENLLYLLFVCGLIEKSLALIHT